jgi:glycosyltransferase involved in cell wall biosynthesis
MKRVVLQWPSFGPYHTARLLACRDQAPPGTEVIGLAVAGQVSGRPWTPDRPITGLKIVTLFPDALYHELPKAEVKSGMRKCLDTLRPCAMGISGYGMTDSREAFYWCGRNHATRLLMTESKADDAPRKWWKELIKRRFVAKFDSALCGGSPHRAYLEELGMSSAKIFDRYDVVDNERFREAADDVRANPGAFRMLPGLSDKRPFFLASSRFIDRKNLPRLIEAYGDYRKENAAGWRLVILGSGPDEGALRNQVLDQSIPDVCFAGFRQFDDLVAYYAFAGAFVHPALQEQWGLVINEAMACGLPIGVSRTTGAAHDLVEDGGNGYTFDPEDVGTIKQTLSQLAADSGAREKMSRRSREIIAHWTPKDFARNFWAALAAGS